MGYGPHVARLNKNENPYGPSPRAIEAITRGLTEANRYVHSLQLRQALAQHHGVEVDMIRLGTGSGEILRVIPIAMMRKGGDVVSTRQTYRATPGVAEQLGATVRWVDLLPDHSYDLDGMLAAVSWHTKIFYLVNPNNPTGSTASYAELRRIADALPKRVLFVIDEAYSDFLPTGERTGIDLLKEGYDNVFVTRTFSKAHGLAGLRVGYGVGKPEIVKQISPFMMTATNTAAFFGALGALGDRAHVGQFVNQARRSREFYEARLPALGFRYVVGHAPLIMVELGPRVQSFVDQARAAGVYVRHGKSWEMPEHVRISYGLDGHNQAVVAALQRLAA
ncbi:MAG: aminotransferase class I/II-fold pyridoxal phosphate-dependent enzyme [Deltaproteobacteria bacterium]|nr:aminotransferase class I/II-fold pyridoxal phosphate-dependent enzyme [Deltaproteobacteria bacterium]